MIALSIFILIFLFVYKKELTLLTFDRESAYLSGINVNFFDLVFYICLAISVVLGTKILGIILVSALLIIPASIAKLLAKSFKSLEVLSIFFAEIIMICGLIISYYLDLPSGAVIILTGTAIFVLFLAIKKLRPA
jgi:zinc transport system permease protein